MELSAKVVYINLNGVVKAGDAVAVFVRGFNFYTTKFVETPSYITVAGRLYQC